jgi:chromosome segregation ATPase
MVPLPRPHGAPEGGKGILELYAAHLQALKSTEHILGSRSLQAPLGTASALFIFVGILICLCIAAPVIASRRQQQGNGVTGSRWRAKRAAVEVDGPGAELASLRQRHERLEQQHVQHENQLQGERSQLETVQGQVLDLEQSVRDRENALTVAERERDITQRERDIAQRERDMARVDVREIQRSHAAALETIQNLERERQAQEESFRSLQQRYNHVDQECRRLMPEMAGNDA